MKTEMKTETKELNLEELEQASAGCVWCIASIAVIGAVGVAFGTAIYRQLKKS